MSARTVNPLPRSRGDLILDLPGDKSISHRAAILGALARGETQISRFLTAGDCLHTLEACRQLGAGVERSGDSVRIRGCGLSGLSRPQDVIDCGNSGTGVRLLAGVLAGQPFESVITGDEQVQRRPMQRIIEPLVLMGAGIESRPGGFCPLRIRGGRLKPVHYVSPVASAQVKSCVLLAGLFAPGETSVTEPAHSRDHTERLLTFFGVPVRREGLTVAVSGQQDFSGREVAVPADISSAAFFLVAGALIPGACWRMNQVVVSPGRNGILEVLRGMGADLALENARLLSGEETADLVIREHGRLQSVQILDPDLIPALIDELPILAVAAAAARGTTEIRNAQELRVKETDRIAVLAGELRKLGVDVEELPDGLAIAGGVIRGGLADSHGDHRLAMSLAVAGLLSEKGVTIENPDCVNTSFPGFWRLMEAIAQ